jgi:MSHA pilin protein MshC
MPRGQARGRSGRRGRAAPRAHAVAASVRAPGSAGFTLVELVVVMALLGIIAMISAPRFITAGARGALAARELQAALRHAAKLAIATGCTIQVDVAGDTYALGRSGGGDCAAAPVIDPRTGTPGYSGSVPGGITSSAPSFLFDGLGRVTDLAAAPIAQVTLGAGGVTILVEGETGFVHLQ